MRTLIHTVHARRPARIHFPFPHASTYSRSRLHLILRHSTFGSRAASTCPSARRPTDNRCYRATKVVRHSRCRCTYTAPACTNSSRSLAPPCSLLPHRFSPPTPARWCCRLTTIVHPLPYCICLHARSFGRPSRARGHRAAIVLGRLAQFDTPRALARTRTRPNTSRRTCRTHDRARTLPITVAIGGDQTR